MNYFSHFTLILLVLAVFTLEIHGNPEFLTVIMSPGESWLGSRNAERVDLLSSSKADKRVLRSGTEERISANIRSDDDLSANEISVPPPAEVAKMARFIVHYSSWGSLSHVSLQKGISGSPIARVYSFSDGPMNASTGIPYFYLTPKDPELLDMSKDPRASLTLSLAQSPYCRAKAYDPEDPRCAQVVLTGKLIFIKNSTAEWQEAQKALFSRHPVMKKWPYCHHWMCCKLEIKRILVADTFGGNKYPSADDYFRADIDTCDNPLIDMAFY